MYHKWSEAFYIFQNWYFSITIFFFLLVNTVYLLVIILGYINARRRYLQKLTRMDNKLTPLKSLKPISVLVPCYNESENIVDSINRMLTLDYPEYEIILCNDGSTDQTLELVIDAFGLDSTQFFPPQHLKSKKIKGVYRSKIYKKLLVIDKENGGKADSLNAAINFSQFPLVCITDADSIIDNSGLTTISMPFLEDELTIASGGAILPLNQDQTQVNDKNTNINTHAVQTWLGCIQAIEYMRAFFVGRLGWDLIRSNPIISGAFGLFKKSLVIHAGGYRTDTIGEDMELVLRMQRICLKAKKPFRVYNLPTPVCWTEPPSDLKTLSNQRTRWSQGLAESLWKNKSMILRPWGGVLGNFVLPYLFIFELVSAPVELLGYFLALAGMVLGIYDPLLVLGFFAMTILYGCILNVCAIVVDQLTYQKYSSPADLLVLFYGAIIEHFGYRQLHLYWRLKGLFRVFLKRQHWGNMKRAKRVS